MKGYEGRHEVTIMADIEYNAVVKLAEQLKEDEQNRLILHLRVQQAAEHAKNRPASMPQSDEKAWQPIRDSWEYARGSEFVDPYRHPHPQELLDELANRKKYGTQKKTESLYGKFANPNVPDISVEDLHSQLQAISSEWEQELDEFFGSKD